MKGPTTGPRKANKVYRSPASIAGRRGKLRSHWRFGIPGAKIPPPPDWLK